MISAPVESTTIGIAKDSFCPKLWESAYINETGDVFRCCHQKGQALGNINFETLRSIWSGPRYQNDRRKSLNGTLECYETCTLLNKHLRPARSATVIPAFETLRWLHIAFGELCNIACIMCWQDHRSRKTQDYESLVKNVDLTYLRNITMQGGEPLAIKSLRRYFDFVSSSGAKVSLMSNGLLINEEWAAKIAKFSDFLYVSLNAASKETHELVNRGSRWEKVLAGVVRVQQARQRYQSSVAIVGHMTIVPPNIEEIADFVRKFKTFGFDRINFGFDASVPRLLDADSALRARLRSNIENALKEQPFACAVDVHRLKLLSLL